MGQFMAIGSICHEQRWAHLQLSAIYLMGNNGSIRSHWQLFSWATMGPFKDIGNFPHAQHWAHLMTSAVFLISNIGPLHGWPLFS
jgi:hypothetical protein